MKPESESVSRSGANRLLQQQKVHTSLDSATGVSRSGANRLLQHPATSASASG